MEGRRLIAGMAEIRMTLVRAKDPRTLGHQRTGGLVDGQTLLVGALDHNCVGRERWYRIVATGLVLELENMYDG